jgi:hypothetical protein
VAIMLQAQRCIVQGHADKWSALLNHDMGTHFGEVLRNVVALELSLGQCRQLVVDIIDMA